MENPSFEVVKKQKVAWFAKYSNNNARGKKYIRFLLGEQWEGNVIQKRTQNNKETLVFNLCARELNKMIAQAVNMEFSLNVFPTNQESLKNVTETNAFKLLFSTFMLSDKIRETLTEALIKCLQFGYSFVELSFKKENRHTLNEVPDLILHRDPSTAFWDSSSIHPCMIDGMFCGIEKNMTRSDIVKLFPKLKDSIYIKDGKTNKIILYWYRVFEDKEYTLLNTGEYKLTEDLTTEDLQSKAAKKPIVEDDEKFPLTKKEPISCIYFKVFVNEKEVIKPEIYPTDDLPLIKHPALTDWHPDQSDFTQPYIYHMEGAQRMHNYINSQLATMAKNSSSAKWLFNPEHVLTAQQINNAKNINSTEGAMTFSGDLSKIVHIKSEELPGTLINMSQMAKQEVEEIGGSQFLRRNAQQAVVSGKALDRISHEQEVFNEKIIKGQICFVNTVCDLVRSMIPKIVTQERQVAIKNQDGSGMIIEINQYIPETQFIKNNIKDITNNFQYSINAGPTSTMQRDNTLRYLSQIYSFNPQFFEITGDIYMRLLQSAESGELERRVSAKMDQNLVKFSKGEITHEDYVKASQQAEMQNIKRQVELSDYNPEVKSARALADVEKVKAMANVRNANTKFLETVGRLQTENDKVQLMLAELLVKMGDSQAYQDVQSVRLFLDANNQILNEYRQTLMNQFEQENNPQQQQQQPQPNQPMQGMNPQNAGPI